MSESEQSFRPETIPVTATTSKEFRDLVKELTDELPLGMDGESRSLQLGDMLIHQAPSIEHRGGTDYSVIVTANESPLEGVVYAIDTVYEISEDAEGVFHAEREVIHEDVSPRTIVPKSKEEQRKYDEKKAKIAQMTGDEFGEEIRRKIDAMGPETRKRIVNQIQKPLKDEERQLGLRDITEQELQQVIKRVKNLG